MYTLCILYIPKFAVYFFSSKRLRQLVGGCNILDARDAHGNLKSYTSF